MTILQNAAVIVELIQRMHEQGSRCAAGHVHAAVYVLQEMAGVDLGLHWIIYKGFVHSFELKDDLASYKNDGILSSKFLDAQYAPSLLVNIERLALLWGRCPKALALYDKEMTFVAEEIGSCDTKELHDQGIALWASKCQPAELSVRIAELERVRFWLPEEEVMRAATDAHDLVENWQITRSENVLDQENGSQGE